MNDLAILSRLEAEYDRRQRENRLRYYRPYGPVAKWHALAEQERALIAANQVGKCVSADTLVESPDGGARRVGDISGEHWVWAWDGAKRVPALALSPFKKPAEMLYRVWLQSGHWFDCAAEHRLLTAAGWRFFSHLARSFPCLPPSTSAPDRVWSSEDVRRYLGTAQGSPGDYRPECHSGDGLPHAAQEADLASAPSLAGALLRSLAWWSSGDRADKGSGSLRGSSRHPSTPDADLQIVGRCAEYQAGARGMRASPYLGSLQESQPLAIAEVSEPRSTLEAEACRARSFALVSPDGSYNSIIGYQPIGEGDIYDFTVPGRGNYCTQGAVHHNTFGAGSEVAMHLTGNYPDWWQGKRFEKAPVGWVAGVTGEATRDNPQRILLGRPGEWGTGTLPKHTLSHVQRAVHRVADAVDYVLVKHKSGQLARCYFKAYDQGREKFQGETLDFGWCDEEPPEDVYIEFLTRLNVSGGPMMLTFTPLLGMSSVVRRFLQEKRKGTAYVSMTIEDAEHYTPEARAAIIDRYPAHEREARTKGIPSLGSGRIFPVTEEMLSYDPFTFPDYWPRIGGIDFGGSDHPAAAAFIAIDPESDTSYVYDCWRSKGLFLEQVAAVRARCKDWIPMAWPHDGLQHDRHSGVQLAEQFRDQGVPMTPERATFDDGTNGVEAGISMMLTMMQTGRLKVARHLRDVFEEVSLYHRRDGKVVKEGDDAISAIRYALMMRRYADTPPRSRANEQVIQTWMA